MNHEPTPTEILSIINERDRLYAERHQRQLDGVEKALQAVEATRLHTSRSIALLLTVLSLLATLILFVAGKGCAA